MHMAEDVKQIDSMIEELAPLMENLRASSASKGRKACKCIVLPPSEVKMIISPASSNVNTTMLKDLASEAEIEDLVALYVDCFEKYQPSTDTADLEEQQSQLRVLFAQCHDGADPGVEVESTLTPDELSKNLGFYNNLPMLFNQFRHSGGLLSWTQQHAHLFEATSEAMNPELARIILHWHQICAVHAMVRMFFAEEAKEDHRVGCLVADEVGLGKTFQSAALIAFMTDLFMRRENGGLPLPPLVCEYSKSCFSYFILLTASISCQSVPWPISR